MKFFLTIFALCLMVYSTPVQAQQSRSADREWLQDRLLFAAGAFDINDHDTTAEVRLEYHWQRLDWRNIHPFAGAMATGDGAVYGYAGIQLDWEFAPNWYLQPSFAPGFFEDGSGKDLGHTIEFRSELGLAHQFASGRRLGISISHMSNASLDDNNPGAESAMIYYSVPLRAFVR